MPATIPSEPSATRSTSGASGSIVITISLAAATFRGVAAGVAPAAASDATASGTTSATISRWPLLRMLRAIGAPIVPSPINPTFISLSRSERNRRSRAGSPALQIPHRRAAQILRVLVVEAGVVRHASGLLVRGLVERRRHRERALDLVPGQRLRDELAVDHALRRFE